MISLLVNVRTVAVAATVVWGGFVYTMSPRRPDFLDSTTARIGTGAAALAVAALVMFGIIPAVIGYAILGVSLAVVQVVDLVKEERARKRRVASLSPRPRADLAPAIWTIVAALSATLLTPYAFDTSNRVAAAIVGLCVVTMAAIAWRIASAPLQLTSCDPVAERDAERSCRARKAGLTSVVAVGVVFVFTCFAYPATAAESSIARVLSVLLLVVWVGMLVWETLYVRHLDRLHADAS